MFEVGDKVEIIGNSTGKHFFEECCIGHIVEVDPNDEEMPYRVMCSDLPQWVASNDIKGV